MTKALEDVVKDYFNGDELATNVWLTKYALKDNNGNIIEKTPDDMHKRLASEFARIESQFGGPRALSEEEIYSLLKDFKYIVPQGSPMMGVGNNHVNVSLSNCVVIESPSDNISSIMDSGKHLANLFKRRCGVGLDISNLRPEGTLVNNSAGTTTGAWSFADFYSYVCRMIGQNGRRGALMISMDIRHPDIEKFITMKHDLEKVTGANVSVKISDDFMHAVEADGEFTLQYPVDSETPSVVRHIAAKTLWNTIVESATNTAEPGILMWDNITKNLPAEAYKDQGFRTLTTNPCFTGDTLIAVADGRDAVSLKQLAAEGKDVPVYSVDPASGEVSIKWGKNPRLTGCSRDILRIHLDDGTHMDVTPEHKIPLLSGETKRAEHLVAGDSLHRFTKRPEHISRHNSKQYMRVNCNSLDSTIDKIYEHRLVAEFYNPETWKETYTAQKENGWAKGGLVVHHKDYNSLNNSPDNLEIMTFKEHVTYHGNKDNSGEKNGKYSGLSNEELEHVALALTKTLGRRFSHKEWTQHSSVSGCPKNFSEWRRQGWFKNPTELAHWAAIECGCEHVSEDPRLVRRYQHLISQGYSARIEDGKVVITKVCEHCTQEFNTLSREISYCSQTCSVERVNSCPDIALKRSEGHNNYWSEKQQYVKIQQMKVCSDLRFELGREPLMKEWERACAQHDISYRLGTKFGFKGYKELQDASVEYNHKVVKIEWLANRQDVYNITVDDNHTVGIITDIKANKAGNKYYTGIFAYQCGEVPLSAFDSCRLISVNLRGFIKNEFQENAYFDFESFDQAVSAAMRMSDDLVELEIEKLDKIIEACDTKDEKELWEKLKLACVNGRRTGLGTHGLADVLACLRLAYDSDEANTVIDKIYETLKISAYTESVHMSEERGSFPVFDWEKEKDNAFIKSLPRELQMLIAHHGRRNISILTNAPTGSVSIMSQTSSGIEPVFRNSYMRRRKLSHNEQNLEADYVDSVGDKWAEYLVFHHNLKHYHDLMNTEEIPNFFTESDQIDWETRIKIQATIQKHIDHSISSTINLPQGTKSDVVGRLYRLGWQRGLKGITVYVDGSRSGVLVSKKDTFPQHAATRRPRNLPCQIHHTTINGEAWVILVGLYENKPYEVIGGLATYVEIPRKYTEGTLIKHPRKTMNSKYDLKFGENGDEIYIKDIVKVFDNPNHSAFTRLISLSLRHGASIQYVVEQMQKDKDSDMFSFAKCVARVLKNYITNGSAASDKVCPSCKVEDGLIYLEGCLTCKHCGFAKCG